MIFFAVLFVVLLVALALVTWYPETTGRWLDRLLIARKLLFAVAGVILAFFLIATGAWHLVLLGAAIFLFMAVYVFDRGINDLFEPS